MNYDSVPIRVIREVFEKMRGSGDRWPQFDMLTQEGAICADFGQLSADFVESRGLPRQQIALLNGEVHFQVRSFLAEFFSV